MKVLNDCSNHKSGYKNFIKLQIKVDRLSNTLFRMYIVAFEKVLKPLLRDLETQFKGKVPFAPLPMPFMIYSY